MDWHLTKSMETRPTAQMDEIAARQSNRIHPTRRKNGYIYVGSSKGLYIFQGEKLQSYLPFSIYGSKGLPGTEIRDLYQTDSHTCWIATNDGLAKLTNGKIKIYEHNPFHPHSLIDNNVCAISQGPDQKLWIATYQGLCLFNPQNEYFTDMTQPGNDCLTSRLTSCITEDRQGNIWIGTTEKALTYCLSKRTPLPIIITSHGIPIACQIITWNVSSAVGTATSG